MNDLNIALLIGCARSGTSILGELIAAHSETKYIFEAQAIWQFAGLGVNDSHRLTAEHATAEIKTHIREWFRAQRGEATLVVEKNPRNVLRIPFLREVFPEAKLIHIVRDGRDVACSLMPGIGGDQWRHLKPPSWQKLLAEQTGIIRCALAWKEILETALDDLSTIPHLQIRYEQLVIQPQEEAPKLLRYLHLPEDAAVIEFGKKIQDATLGSYHAQHQKRWYREDHAFRIGRWRENLPTQEQDAIGKILHPLLHRLGYV